MDMDNSVRMDCGSRGWAGPRRAKGENWYNCKSINKNKKENIIKQNLWDTVKAVLQSL